MGSAVLEVARLEPGESISEKAPRKTLRRQRNWQLLALRWLALVTAGLGVLLFAALILQSYAVVRSFRATDALVQELSGETLRERLAARAQEMTAQAADGSTAATALGDDEIIKRGTNLRLAPDEIVQLLAEREGASKATVAEFAARLKQDAERIHQNEAYHSEQRVLWQRRSYWLVLLTSNLALLSFGAAFGLVAFYIAMEAAARRGEIRARRAVMDTERNRTSFLAAAGHDLRQPIQAIELFLATLLQRSLDNDTKGILHKIDAASASMKRMISGLLDIAKLDAGLVSTDSVDVQLDELLAPICGEFEQLAVVKGLTLSIPKTGAVVQTDPVLFESILRNLLSNAIRYTEQGGVGVRVQQTGQGVRVTVFDTGIGIPEDKRDAIFQDFCRLHSIATEGLGLGLGIVRRLCALLRCDLLVVSAVGHGSEFSLVLQAGRRVTGPRHAPSTAVLPEGYRVTALLLEDNATLRDALAGQLGCWDIDVIQAGTSAQARAVIRGSALRKVDIVIADYHLPDDNGLRVLYEIERDIPGCPCLLITGASDEGELKKIRNSGVRWLPKPLDSRHLRAEVQRLVTQAAENHSLEVLSREL